MISTTSTSYYQQAEDALILPLMRHLQSHKGWKAVWMEDSCTDEHLAWLGTGRPGPSRAEPSRIDVWKYYFTVGVCFTEQTNTDMTRWEQTPSWWFTWAAGELNMHSLTWGWRYRKHHGVNQIYRIYPPFSSQSQSQSIFSQFWNNFLHQQDVW